MNSAVPDTDTNLIKEYQKEFESFSYNPNSSIRMSVTRDSKILRNNDDVLNVRASQMILNSSIPENDDFEGF